MRTRRYIISTLLLIFIAEGVIGQNLVSLHYDDGEADDGIGIDDLRGHSVLYSSPCDNWTLASVAIYGKRTLDSKSDMFVVEVWDENLTLLSKSTDRIASFFGSEFEWAVLDIPVVMVSNNFLINFYEFNGVYVGVDFDAVLAGSLITARNPNRILGWDVSSLQQNQTNWMIRALGYSPGPQISINVSSTSANGDNPAVIELKAKDRDGNLDRAILYVVKSESQEVVWSEVKSLKGYEAETQFFWSGKTLKISNSIFSLIPVSATNNIEIAEDVSSYVAFSAPCILQLDQGNFSIPSIAYFGDNGKFNALIDVLGRDHYLSRDILKIIAPDVDYADYMANNITLSKDESTIIFYKMVFGPDEQSLVSYPPISLSKSPLFNYGLMLEPAEADSGEYIAMVMVEDSAYNSVGMLGDRKIVK